MAKMPYNPDGSYWFLNDNFFPAYGNHGRAAIEIIEKNGWTEDWMNSDYFYSSDYLIYCKDAVSISNDTQTVSIASKNENEAAWEVVYWYEENLSYCYVDR